VNDEQTIAAGKVVSIDYVLTDTAGKELERSAEGKPLVYLHGARNVVKGLEEALEGKAPGDSLEVTVSPEKGYGPKGRLKPQRILRSKFPETAQIEKGARFVMQGPEGPFPIWVTKVMGREVQVTPEHPLTGQTLCYRVTVREVRDATDEEKKHGHAHGPGGHHEHEDEAAGEG
jgi:FKBP-type peptidyl-prolyl cis-trans isomerase SlyD